MSFQISPFGNDQFFTPAGALAVGYKLYTYLVGSTTKQATFTDLGGLTPQTNPIVLNSLGMPPSPIFLDKSIVYKFVYASPADSDPPAAPLYTVDGVNVGTVLTEGGNITGGINVARTTVPSALAPDIFAVTVGNTVDYTGVVTCTGFAAAPQAGPQRLLVCASTPAFVASANLLIDGVPSGQTYTAKVNEKILAVAITTTVTHLLPIASIRAMQRAQALGFLRSNL
ncbi:MAG: hypothetical protein KGL39_18740 [Patescibacteria group bacterium]|nr:hypothetical protein [Patescibacteria group bacterium]